MEPKEKVRQLLAETGVQISTLATDMWNELGNGIGLLLDLLDLFEPDKSLLLSPMGIADVFMRHIQQLGIKRLHALM